MYIITSINKFFTDWRNKRKQKKELKKQFLNACQIANALFQRTGKTQFVIKDRGVFRVYDGYAIHYLHRNRCFKKNLSLRQIFSSAVYVTKKKPCTSKKQTMQAV